MLTETQFGVLRAAIQTKGKKKSQRELAQILGCSLGKINSTLKDLTAGGFIDGQGGITSLGLSEMEPYKVKNAIIMAAGMSSRFVPLSYERPKALLKVKN